MDRYGNVIYLTPMVLGAFASIFAAACVFSAFRSSETTATNAGRASALPEGFELARDEPGFRRSAEVDALVAGENCQCCERRRKARTSRC